MEETDLIKTLAFLLPSIIVGIVAYYFFKMHTDNEEKRRRFLMRKENQKLSLPIRLQAYERMALFLERISPGKLLTRITPGNHTKEEYRHILIQTIEQEFEHNLAQQIYLSAECWNVIKNAKNSTIATLRRVAMDKEIKSADQLRQVILTSLMDQTAPTDTALHFVKDEVKNTI